MKIEVTSAADRGAWFRGQREARGIGLNDLARRMGISPTFLSRFEQGKREVPAEDHLRIAAAELGLDGDDVVVRCGRVPEDVTRWLLEDAARMKKVRTMMGGAR